MEIWDWEWDDANIQHLSDHEITPGIVVEIADLDDPRFREDEDEEHAATSHMIGMDGAGKMWVICVVEVDDERHVWRAFTGWEAEDDDQAWYWRNR